MTTRLKPGGDNNINACFVERARFAQRCCRANGRYPAFPTSVQNMRGGNAKDETEGRWTCFNERGDLVLEFLMKVRRLCGFRQAKFVVIRFESLPVGLIGVL